MSMSPMSEARKRANKTWNDANMKERYDRIQLVVPKGQRDVIKDRAAALGLSVNAYVLGLVEADLAGGGGYPAHIMSTEGERGNRIK